MDERIFTDALTGNTLTFDMATNDVILERGDGKPLEVKSIFFPGCSMINYAMPLTAAVYDTLLDAGVVDGISVLCCGKILSYEPNGAALRESFEEELKEHIAAAGIERIVCACPNCVKALRDAFAQDARMEGVSIDVLPQVLVNLGYSLDPATCGLLVKGDSEESVLFCPHDSCPDRDYGDFARALRAIIPDGMWVDPEHCYSRSICCGSIPRAAGKYEAADKCANINGEDAVAVHADALITACMSCCFQLNMAQSHVQCVHYLEMLYSWRINWATVGQWMKLRFLFKETLGAIEKDAPTGRAFEGLGEDASAPETLADGDVTISEANTNIIGE